MMKVVNRKPSGVPDGAVYVGRPTIYGNPFRIGPDGTREEVIEKFARYFYKRVRTDAKFRGALEKLRNAEALACWCAPALCHATVIAEYLHESSGRS